MILWEISFFSYLNNSQIAVWKYKSLIAKTFQWNYIESLKSISGNKDKETMFPVVSRSDIQVKLSARNIGRDELNLYSTAQKTKFSFKDFFSKCDQICRKVY